MTTLSKPRATRTSQRIFGIPHRMVRSFKIEAETTRRLRVSAEVLGLDPSEIKPLFGTRRVAQTLRQAGDGRAILVTTEDTRVEPT